MVGTLLGTRPGRLPRGFILRGQLFWFMTIGMILAVRSRRLNLELWQGG